MKKRNIYRALIFIWMIPLLLQGCKKDNSQELLDQEMRILKQYLAENNITQEPRSSGLYYIVIEEGTGIQASSNYFVDFNYTTELVSGTVVATSHEDVAKDNDLFSESKLYGPIRSKIGYTGVPGVDEGLTFMFEKGISKLIVPSTINGVYPSNFTTNIYTIELVNTFDDPEKFQTNQIILYMQEQGIDSVFVTESGLHFINQGDGQGEFIKNGDIVDLWYTGRFLDGRVFDSNLGETVMTVDMPAAGYIEAWDEGLKLMKNGSKARLIVPYELAYGTAGRGPIPPYMTLVFDIEIVKLTPL